MTSLFFRNRVFILTTLFAGLLSAPVWAFDSRTTPISAQYCDGTSVDIYPYSLVTRSNSTTFNCYDAQTSAIQSGLRYAFEDGGGDHDYNDIIVDVWVSGNNTASPVAHVRYVSKEATYLHTIYLVINGVEQFVFKAETSTPGTVFDIPLPTRPCPDFTLKSDPDKRTINQGEGTSFNLSIQTSGGFSSAVSLSVTGLPLDASATFGQNPLPVSASTSMDITTKATVAAGTYPLTITATSGSISRTTQVSLEIKASTPLPDFVLHASPASQTIYQGAASDFAISADALNGFSGTINLSVSGLPGGATAIINPSAMTTSAQATISIQTSAATATGTYTLQVSGKSGALEHTVSIALTIQPVNFTLQINATPNNGLSPLDVQFRAFIPTASAFPANFFRFHWDFGDGNGADIQNPLHTYLHAGNYTATCTATPSAGSAKTASLTVTVLAFSGTINKAFSVTEAVRGQELALTIKVNNTSAFDFNSITVWDDIPAALMVLNDTGSAVPSQQTGRRINWVLPYLKSGASATLQLQLKVTASAVPGVLTNIAYLQHASLNTPLASNSATLTIQKLKISVQKSVDKTSAKPGEALQYTILLRNDSPVALEQFTLLDTLAPALQLVSHRESCAFSQSGQILKWQGTLAANSSLTIDMQARLGIDVIAGSVVENRADLAAATLTETIVSNTVRTTIGADPINQTQIQFTKRATTPQAEVGRIISFHLTVINQSRMPLLAPYIEDALPQGFSYVAQSSVLNGQRVANPHGTHQLLWQLPIVMPGQTLDLQYQVVIGSDAARGNNINRATLHGHDNSGRDIVLNAEAMVSISNGGFMFYSSLSGTVFLDRDGDGFYGGGDTPLPNVEVSVSTGQKTFTDMTGRYTFGNLFPGEYAVSVNRATLPRKFQPESLVPQLATLTDGLADILDFAIKFTATDDSHSASLFGRVFYDKNQNRTYEASDPLASEFSARLDSRNETRGANGAFTFTNLTPGSHQLEINYAGKSLKLAINLNKGTNTLDVPLPFSGVIITISGEK